MKIATLMLKHDYGISSRGPSNEIKYFLPAIEKIAPTVSLWLEDKGFPDDLPVLQFNIKEFIEKEQPTHVFMILMREEVSRETMDWMRARGIKVINWFCDDQWRLAWSLDVGKHLSLAVTTDKYSLKAYERAGIPVVLSQWASSYYQPILAKSPAYQWGVTFVGSKNSVREWYIDMLKDAGIKVECFGAGWENGRVKDEYLRDIFRLSEINLNLSNSATLDVRYLQRTGGRVEGHKFSEQIKARHFEIPACGGFQLAHYALEVEDYYTIGKEIAVFGGPEDLIKQIRYYQDHKEERENIRHFGWVRSIGYTYEERMKGVFL